MQRLPRHVPSSVQGSPSSQGDPSGATVCWHFPSTQRSTVHGMPSSHGWEQSDAGMVTGGRIVPGGIVPGGGIIGGGLVFGGCIAVGAAGGSGRWNCA
jgi:hypothetical protein